MCQLTKKFFWGTGGGGGEGVEDNAKKTKGLPEIIICLSSQWGWKENEEKKKNKFLWGISKKKKRIRFPQVVLFVEFWTTLEKKCFCLKFFFLLDKKSFLLLLNFWRLHIWFKTKNCVVTVVCVCVYLLYSKLKASCVLRVCYVMQKVSFMYVCFLCVCVCGFFFRASTKMCWPSSWPTSKILVKKKKNWVWK